MQRPLRILLVDDEPHERALAAAVLRADGGGFDIGEVKDAIAFAEELAANRFDAAIVATGLRWAEPVAVVDAVKRAGRSRAVILFTPPDADQLVLAAYKRGLDDHLVKSPEGFVRLPGLVRAAIERVAQHGATGEGRLQRLLDRMGRATLRCAIDGRMLEVNAACSELLGFAEPRDALRTNAFDLLCPTDVRAAFEADLREKRFARLERVSIPAAEGRTLTATLSAIVAKEQGGTLTVTALVEPVAEPVVAKALGVAHDLKEPLRTLARSAEALEKRLSGRLDGAELEELSFLAQAARRMQGQVSSAFGETRLTPVPVPESPTAPHEADVAEALEIVRANLRGAIESVGARITTGTLPRVGLAPDDLVQLLQNLVGNAVKYRGDAPPRVHVTADRRDDTWVLSVSDNGVGIAPADRERIFGLFQRVERPGGPPGSGIGLNVCRRIVEHAGGRIWVDSEPGDGATFSCALPAVAEPPTILRPKKRATS